MGIAHQFQKAKGPLQTRLAAHPGNGIDEIQYSTDKQIPSIEDLTQEIEEEEVLTEDDLDGRFLKELELLKAWKKANKIIKQ